MAFNLVANEKALRSGMILRYHERTNDGLASSRSRCKRGQQGEGRSLTIVVVVFRCQGDGGYRTGGLLDRRLVIGESVKSWFKLWEMKHLTRNECAGLQWLWSIIGHWRQSPRNTTEAMHQSLLWLDVGHQLRWWWTNSEIGEGRFVEEDNRSIVGGGYPSLNLVRNPRSAEPIPLDIRNTRSPGGEKAQVERQELGGRDGGMPPTHRESQ